MPVTLRGQRVDYHLCLLQHQGIKAMFTIVLCIVASYLEKNKGKKDSSILNSLNMVVI